MNNMTTGHRILLVEDNPSEEVLTLRAIARCGVACEVEVARDGAEALERLSIPPWSRPGPAEPRPHLVILDLKLPKLGGLQVLRRIRDCEETAALPVVVFTSSDEPRDRAQSVRLGANSYVRKPIEYARLNEVVASIVHYWLLVNEPPSQEERP